ncbi:hypothetical protein ACQEVF_44685 [Nonomuraea polychroma]|uniref:hypothetical protein n=1 Tax=Nonomuraea polychroma TaxID=46176 RepID=UPI003D905B0A
MSFIAVIAVRAADIASRAQGDTDGPPQPVADLDPDSGSDVDREREREHHRRP